MLEQVQPQDLIRYGLIPEFVGRLAVVSVLNDLDEPALVEILTQPKNALVRQYQRLFEFENVKLRFTEGALEADRGPGYRAESGSPRIENDPRGSDAGPDVPPPQPAKDA